MDEDQEKYEWKEMSPEADLRQGDLLIARNQKTKAIEQMAVVITADCDIEQKKFGPQVACLNIQYHDAYIRTTWAARTLQTAKANALKLAADQVRAIHTRLIGEESSLSDGAIEDWLFREEAETVARELELDADGIRGFVKDVTPCRAGLLSLHAAHSHPPFDQLHAFTSAYKEKSAELTRKDLLKKAHGDTLPADAFLIPGFPTDPNKPTLVMLREIMGVPSEKIKTRQSEILDKTYFLRVGRLRSTFKFALSQAFGSLYSRIGLPTAYERRRKQALIGTLTYEWK